MVADIIGESVRSRRRINVGGGVAEGQVSTSLRSRGRPAASEQVQDHVFPVQDYEGEPARVRVEGSVTRNLGDFNSVKVGVVLELPCAADLESLNVAKVFADSWVTTQISQELGAFSTRVGVGGGDGV